jgi:hypothetical protein
MSQARAGDKTGGPGAPGDRRWMFLPVPGSCPGTRPGLGTGWMFLPTPGWHPGLRERRLTGSPQGLPRMCPWRFCCGLRSGGAVFRAKGPCFFSPAHRAGSRRQPYPAQPQRGAIIGPRRLDAGRIARPFRPDGFVNVAPIPGRCPGLKEGGPLGLKPRGRSETSSSLHRDPPPCGLVTEAFDPRLCACAARTAQAATNLSRLSSCA